MNFKTTIVLLVLLLGIGTYVLLTRDTGTGPAAPPTPRTLLDVKSADVSAFTITGEGHAIAAAKRDGKWRLTQPVDAAADAFKVGALVDELTALKSTATVAPDVGHTGLDHPQYTVELTVAGKPTKLLVGNALGVGDGVYVQVSGTDRVDVAPASLLETLGKPVSDLRSTQLLTLTTSDVKQLTIARRDGSTLSLEKQPKGWQIVKPMLAPADASAAEDLVATLVNLQPVEFVDGPRAAAAGFERPMATVTLGTAAPATQPATTVPATTMPATVIRIGSYDGVEKKNVFASMPDGTVVKLAATVLDTINKKPLDLRDKTVLDVDPAKVTAVTIAMDQPATTQPVAAAMNHVVALSHRPKNATLGPALPTTKSTTAPATMPASQWVVGSADADDAKVTALLGQLHPLKADKYLDAAPAVKPVRQFTVTITAGGAPTVLTLVDPGNGAAVVGAYNGLTFEVPAVLATDLAGDFAKGTSAATPALPGPGDAIPPNAVK